MDQKIAAQIAGFGDYKNAEQADHPITREEHDFACEIAHEIAARNGFDLDAAVAAHHASLRAYEIANGYA